MKDVSIEGLAKGQNYVSKNLEARVKRKKMSRFQAKQTISSLVPQLDYNHFEQCDVLIEAVFEDLALKHRVIAELEDKVGEHTVIATNTSALPIAKVAEKSKRPENILGMHYFSPVHKMPLLEIIVTDQTSDRAAAIAVDVGIRQGKTVIVVRDAPGFYTTRILTALTDEAAVLALQGVDLHRIDRAMQAFGFPVGPITLIDEVGMDVAAHIAKDLGQAFGARLCSGKPEFLEKFVEAGMMGRKSKKGFYLYDSAPNKKGMSFFGKKKSGGSKPINPFAAQMIEEHRVEQDGHIPNEEIQKRLAYRMVNEAVFCLEQGVLSSPVDGDIGAVFGLGFPPFLGGPFRYLDSIGDGSFADELKRFRDRLGERFTPAQRLVELAEDSKRFHS